LASTRPLTVSEAGKVATALRADPRVRGVVPDVREQRQAVTPNDQRFAQQWWLQARSAPVPGSAANTGTANFAQAWETSRGAPVQGAAAVVAVLDSGITSHPELNSRLLPGYDFVSNGQYANDGNGRDNDPADPGDAIADAQRVGQPAVYGNCPGAPLASWHGTIIAGQVAAVTDNTEGVAAANWQARFVPVRVAGQCGAAVSDIVDGMRWAAGLAVPGVPANPNPARLVVLSYGGTAPCDENSAAPEVAATARLYRETIAEMRAAGALVFVAAGNQRGAVARPADCRGAIGVTALNREGFKANYANFGPALALATPGGDARAPGSGATCDDELADSGIVSTGNFGDTAPGAAGYVASSGTSFAAPAAAAAASLMLALNPTLTVDQLEAGLRASAAPFPVAAVLGECSAGNPGRCTCTTSTCGAGLLDAAEALRWAVHPGAYLAPVRTAAMLSGSRLDTCAAKLGRLPTGDPAASQPTTADPAASAVAGSGGGALGPLWTLGLLCATLALRRSALKI
jgi:serine protease